MALYTVVATEKELKVTSPPVSLYAIRAVATEKELKGPRPSARGDAQSILVATEKELKDAAGRVQEARARLPVATEKELKAPQLSKPACKHVAQAPSTVATEKELKDFLRLVTIIKVSPCSN